MENKDIEFQDGKFEQINTLLSETLTLFKEDRKEAKDNYDTLHKQLENIHDEGMYMSEDGKLEREMNTAFKLYLDSGKRLEKVVEILTRIIIEQLNNESKEKIAKVLLGGDGDKYVDSPVDITALLKG